jgi:hypothetical protein
MVTMSEIFCTECGAKNDGHNQFCVVCGALLPKVESLPVKESPVHSEAQQVAESDSDSSKAKFKLSKGKGLVVLALVLSFVLGVALTSQNVFSAVIGDRYTEKRLKNEKVQSYDLGYSSGESDGYPKAYADGETAGIESGYIRGKHGVVISQSPVYPFPDAHGHGIHADDEPTYDVRFEAAHLWPQGAEDAQVHVAVFESYLELDV